jgi:hypothetical protein
MSKKKDKRKGERKGAKHKGEPAVTAAPSRASVGAEQAPLARRPAAAAPAKPSYLGLLNAIAVGESRAATVLAAWRDATADRELAAVLNLVAIREAEHAAAFTKRICELGFAVRDQASDAFSRQLSLAQSDAGDAEKFAVLLNLGEDRQETDPFRNLFADQSIDPATGALLGRYIAEERDSGRRLRAAYQRLVAPAPSAAPVPDVEVLLADVVRRLEALSNIVSRLDAVER